MRRRFHTLACLVALACVGLVVTSVVVAPAASAGTQTQVGLVSDNPVNYTPNILDGSVKTIVQVGSTVIVGGTFTQVQLAGSVGPVLTRNRILAFDATTGALSTTFLPSFDDEVSSLVLSADGKSVYAGGAFNTLNGVNARKLVKLNVADGQKVAAFKPAALNGKVNDLNLTNGRLFVAGSFSTVGGVTRPALASMDPTTGALTGDLTSVFAGTNNGGTTAITKFDVDPAGTRLVAIGNFTTVDGLDRRQAVMIDTSVSPAVVAPWQTNFYKSTCASAFDSYMRDLDISPDGSYVVISTTGAYRGADSACDVISRFEMGSATADLKPTWRDYTGGDTTYAVEITGSVVYVGGHMRWLNNPFAGDSAGAGAIPREGIAALDPVNGLPFSWNPGRTRGTGVFDMLATPTGLWVGSDTDRLANELRSRIAFLPLSGGTPIPAGRTGALPGDVYLTGTPAAVDPSVLFRVNAGGPELPSTDDGPNWLADNTSTSIYHNTGGSTATFGAVPSVDATVPNTDADRAPRALFDTQRSDPSALPEMAWTFTVPAGKPLTVRLYLADRNSSTTTVGKRRFSVDLDGVNKLANLDLNATPGHNIGTMRSFDITSDGRVDIAFRHGLLSSDPLVNGIEILDRSVGGGSGTDGDTARMLTWTGSTAPGPVTTSTGIAWGRTRGSMLVDGTVYSGATDGTLTARSFDGSTFGPATPVDLFGNTLAADLPTVTGMVYADGRMYYTMAGDPKLYYRYFTSESRIVGASRFEATGDLAAMSPARVNGMFLSGSTLYLADRTDHHLYSVQLSGGVVTGPAVLADASVDWRARGAFVRSGPTARLAAPSCSANSCGFDAGASSVSTGTITGYAWSFGDGSTGSGSSVTHAYAAGGSYTVTVTVTDDAGLRSTATAVVTPTDPVNQPPTAQLSASCTLLDCTVSGVGSADSDGSVASYQWTFGDGESATTATATTSHSYAGAGTPTISLVVLDDKGAPSAAATQQVTVAPAPASPIGFRASATTTLNQTNHKITVPATAQAGDAMLLFVTTNSLQDIAAAPAGWTQAGVQESGAEMRTTLFTKVATAADAGAVQTTAFAAATKADQTLLVYCGTAADPFAAVASAGETTAQAAHSTPGSTVTTAGSWVVSYWTDKSSATTGWTMTADQSARSASAGTGGGRVTSASADAGRGFSAGAVPGATATADSPSAKATMWTVVLAPTS